MSEPIEVLATGKYLRLVKRGHWEYADRVNSSGAVVIIAVTDENKLILTEQHRLPLDQRVIELPAGLAGDSPSVANEDLAVAAQRELLEETGYEAGAMTLLTSGPTSAGLSTEVVTLFQARQLRRLHAGGGDEHEDIVVHEVPLIQIGAWLEEKQSQGFLIDPKVYAGLYFAAGLQDLPGA